MGHLVYRETGGPKIIVGGDLSADGPAGARDLALEQGAGRPLEPILITNGTAFVSI